MITGTNIAVIIITWLLVMWYGKMDGIWEAMYWHIRSRKVEDLGVDEHSLFSLERIVVGALAMMAYAVQIQNIPMIITQAVAITISFPFYHNGHMFKERHRLNPLIYLDGFMSDPSSTSTARHNFSYVVRRNMFVAGLTMVLAQIVVIVIWT